ncbi:MAG: hypothetical protein WBW33_19070 [Bryobacteraceae bacterium]
MLRSRCLGTAALAALSLQTVSATSIVILRSSSEVVIGADSTRTLRNPQGSFVRPVCKIIPAGELLFVAAGLTFANGEDVADLAQKASARYRGTPAASDPNAVMDDFRQRVQPFLISAFAAQGRLDLTRSEREQGRVSLEVAYIGINGGRTAVVVEKYRAVGTTKLDIRVLAERHVYNSETLGRYTYIFLGSHRAIDKYADSGAEQVYTTDGASRAIFRLISQEESASSGATGGAIDIASLSQRGLRWLRSKPGCAVSPEVTITR